MATLIAMLIRPRPAPPIFCANKRSGARATKTPLSRIAAAKSHRLVTGLLRRRRCRTRRDAVGSATVTRLRYEMAIVVACYSEMRRPRARGRKRHYESVDRDR